MGLPQAGFEGDIVVEGFSTAGLSSVAVARVDSSTGGGLGGFTVCWGGMTTFFAVVGGVTFSFGVIVEGT